MNTSETFRKKIIPDRFIRPHLGRNYQISSVPMKEEPTKDYVKKMHYSRNIWQRMVDAKVIPSTEKPFCEVKQKQEEKFWPCTSRNNSFIRPHEAIRSPIFKAMHIYSTMIGISRNATVASVTHNVFFHTTKMFKADVKNERIIPMPGASCLYVDQKTDEVYVGFKSGLMQVFGVSSKEPKDQWHCCNEENSKCFPSTFTKHPFLNMIYWTCNHGLIWRDLQTHSSRRNVMVRWSAIHLKVNSDGRFLASSVRKLGIFIFKAYSLESLHNILPGITVGRAMDWHPWMSNILVTGGFEAGVRIVAWDVKQSSITFKVVANFDGLIFSLLFHPYSGELIFGLYTPDHEWPYITSEGESSLVVLDGFGKIVDCSEDGTDGLITHLCWDDNGAQVVAAYCSEIIKRFFFAKPQSHWKPKKPARLDKPGTLLSFTRMR